MQKFKSVGARPLVAAAGALVIGLAGAASFAGPAAAAPKTGSAEVVASPAAKRQALLTRATPSLLRGESARRICRMMLGKTRQ